MSNGIHEDKWTGIALCSGPQIAARGITADEFAIFQICLIECYGANQIDADRVWSGQMGREGSMAWSLNETWCSEAQNYGGKPSFTMEKPNFYGGKISLTLKIGILLIFAFEMMTIQLQSAAATTGAPEQER